MSRVRSSNTKPEVRLRHALWSQGFRYRVNDKRLPGKPDIVLPKYRSVIFVHGCFWHGHGGCSKYSIPKTNTEFWINKVKRNQERDQEDWRKLEAKGWSVIIVWECELENRSYQGTIRRIVSEIIDNRILYLKRMKERNEEKMRRQKELSVKKAVIQSHLDELSQVLRGLI